MSAYDESVKKSTKNKSSPPKRKHVRNIVIETWKECGGNGFFTEIFKRSIETNDLVCWKSLIAIHHVLQEGHPKVLEDAFYRNSFFDSLRNTWGRGVSTSNKGYNDIIQLYTSFLQEKVGYHHTHPEFTGDFNLDKYLQTRESKDIEKNLQSVTHMLDLQQSICKIGKKLFDQKDLIDIKTACLIPLVVEAYNLYTLETHIIRRLVDEVDSMDVLTFLIEQFYAQYITLRNFFYDCSGVKYVSSVIAVPTLPKDPPEFLARRRVNRPKKEEEKPKQAPPPQPQPQPQPRPQQPVVQYVPQPAPQPVVQTNLFDSPFAANPFATSNPFAASNPFAPAASPSPSSWVTFDGAQPFTPVAVAAPQTQAQLPNKVVRKDFEDLVSLVKDMKPSAEMEKKRKEEEQKKKEEEERRKRELERKAKEEEDRRKKIEEERRRAEAKRREEEAKRKEEEDRKKREQERLREEEERRKREEERLREEQERVRNIVKEETSNEIKELKLRIVELERLLALEKEKNRAATKEISDLQALIESLKREVAREKEKAQEVARDAEQKDILITQLTSQNKMLIEEADGLTVRLDNLMREAQEERQRIIDREISNALEAIDLNLSKLDNPTNLGNENATVDDVVEDTVRVGNATNGLITACNSGTREDLLDALKHYAKTSHVLFDDVKGASRKVDDNDARQRLLDGVRSAGDALARLLGSVKGMGGKAETNEDKQLLSVDGGNVTTKLKDLATAAQDTEKNLPQEDDSGVDLEGLAEQELLAAARVIEQAAQALLAQKAAPKPDNVIPGVADAILEAAMAITKATSMLVTAAAAAQKERIEKGKISPTGKVYKRDPRWSQGLISAAKAVAGATQTLILTANDVAQGKIEEENVIAASKAVAASTAQLVAATRAKADDPNSPAQLKLGFASRAVTAATTQLVEAAKAASWKDEENYADDATASGIQRKIKEMELQTHILKLEKELNSVRNRLFDLRKQEYNPNAQQEDTTKRMVTSPSGN